MGVFRDEESHMENDSMQVYYEEIIMKYNNVIDKKNSQDKLMYISAICIQYAKHSFEIAINIMYIFTKSSES